MESNAQFSEDKLHRLVLTRTWDSTKPKVMFIGLNPSIAGVENNDPTIRRVIGFAKDWGMGGVIMVNLYSFIQTKPKNLNTNNHIDTDFVIWEMGQQAEMVVFAWGAHPTDRLKYMEQSFPNAVCLQKNKDGSPKHPLYCRKDLTPIPWKS